MRFWELASVCRNEPELMARLAGDPNWAKYGEWYSEFAELVREQVREKLDAELPDEACVHVLRASRAEYYESDHYVRTQWIDPGDRQTTAADIFTRYGGSFLEDVCEFGSALIPRPD